MYMEGNTTLADATQVIDDPMETNENEKSENKKPGKSKVWNHFKLLERKKRSTSQGGVQILSQDLSM
ncbi:unnamed protein product [Ilex paraguariensis]|uniref:Uncharacterized protein n=1 Tax=Ilex paraguariensis TaxID=185542 RepID=A0ABC8U264_9AQUA